MKCLDGKVTLLGNSTMRGELVNYSLIQIGGKTVTGLHINRKLDNFLQAAVQSSDSTRLWLVGSGIVAVKVGEGTRYYSRISGAFWFASVLGVLLCFAMLSINLWAGLLFGGVVAWLHWRPLYQYLSWIPRDGGVKV